jgi:hypothetical protein
LGDNRLKLEIIEWVDSEGVGQNWQEIDSSVKRKLVTCFSFGFVCNESDEAITVFPHYAHANEHYKQGQGCGEMTIPKVAILSRSVVAVLDEGNILNRV